MYLISLFVLNPPTLQKKKKIAGALNSSVLYVAAIARALISIEDLFSVFPGPASRAKGCRDLANALSTGVMGGLSQLQGGRDTPLTTVRSHHTETVSEMTETTKPRRLALLFYT